MHAFILLTSLLLIILGSRQALKRLQQLRNWSQRRYVHCFILAAPLASLALGVIDLCMQTSLTWDAILNDAFLLFMTIFVVGAVGLGLLRLALMAWYVARQRGIPDAQLQALIDDLARRSGAASPRGMLHVSNQPLAFTYGVFRPTVLLSTWMLEMLDERELEAVLIHELEHIARRDYLIVWLATILRDAFFYLPTTRAAYQQLQQEKELACDDLAVQRTHRPLALASALTKIWLYAVETPRSTHFTIAQTFEGASECLQGRIRRLMAHPESLPGSTQAHSGALSLSLSAVATPLLSQVVSTLLMLLAMGCGPLLFLAKWF